MKKIQKKPIYILNDGQIKWLKENYKREQSVIYICEICKKENRTNLRLIKDIHKLCSLCSLKKSIKEKYGVDNVFQLEKVKEKIKQTNLDKYGTECASQSEVIKEKIKQTNLEKYGVSNVFQLEKIKEKIKQTNLDKYGTEYASQSEIVKEKAKQTILEKYGCKYAMQSEVIKEKTKQTNLDKYGSEHPYFSTETENFKHLIKEKYGVENISQSEIIKEKKEKTCFEHYGVGNPLKSEEVKEKQKQTMLRKYGVEYPLQYPDFFIKSKAKYNYNDIMFDSSWELAFWIYNKEYLHNNIIHEPYSIEYCVDNKKYFYYPDFKIDEQLYEIKGDQFFKNGKMINPFNKNDKKIQEKYNCMKNNNIKILLYKDIKPILEFIKNERGNNYLQLFRKKNER